MVGSLCLKNQLFLKLLNALPFLFMICLPSPLSFNYTLAKVTYFPEDSYNCHCLKSSAHCLLNLFPFYTFPRCKSQLRTPPGKACPMASTSFSISCLWHWDHQETSALTCTLVPPICLIAVVSSWVQRPYEIHPATLRL